MSERPLADALRAASTAGAAVTVAMAALRILDPAGHAPALDAWAWLAATAALLLARTLLPHRGETDDG